MAPGVRRLTESLGYDGGPFFSPDGKRIVWRRFSPDGHTAEVWSMKIDGSDKRQLTRLGHMSWAPFYHPSGDYLIFTTNVHGFENFELYIVDTEGRRDPVRVTHTPGWDGLPAFSPDGQRLVWSTKRSADGKAQLFIADWNDATARAELGLTASGATSPVVADLSKTSKTITAGDIRRHVEALTDPTMNGRMTGTVGEARATSYVASVFHQLGLSPAGDEGWLQPFEFTAGVSLGEPNALTVVSDGTTARPVVDKDWRPLAFSKNGQLEQRDLVFAGYGIVAKATKEQPAYDAYTGLDVTDRWVVVFPIPSQTPLHRPTATPRAVRFASLQSHGSPRPRRQGADRGHRPRCGRQATAGSLAVRCRGLRDRYHRHQH